LKKSGTFEIVDRDKAELKQWKIYMEKDKTERNKVLEIAEKVKDESMDMDQKTIKKMTGLYMHEIRKL